MGYNAMNKLVPVSEEMYKWLEAEAKRRNVASVDLVLADILVQQIQKVEQRRNAGQDILELHERMKAKYGLVDDSTELIRQDRER